MLWSYQISIKQQQMFAVIMLHQNKCVHRRVLVVQHLTKRLYSMLVFHLFGIYLYILTRRLHVWRLCALLWNVSYSSFHLELLHTPPLLFLCFCPSLHLFQFTWIYLTGFCLFQPSVARLSSEDPARTCWRRSPTL